MNVCFDKRYDRKIQNLLEMSEARSTCEINVSNFIIRFHILCKYDRENDHISFYFTLSNVTEPFPVKITVQFAGSYLSPPPNLNNVTFSNIFVFSPEQNTFYFPVEMTGQLYRKLRFINSSPELPLPCELIFHFVHNPTINSVILPRNLRSKPFIGIQNLGATCYMNCFLQSLYVLSSFRSLIYSLPTQGDSQGSITLNLQKLFATLQTNQSRYAVSAQDLTRSFGWDSSDTEIQHDVQEFSRVLLDHLQSKIQSLNPNLCKINPDSIGNLFRGKSTTIIKGINIPFEKKNVEDFYDLSIHVEGHNTLEDSFKTYCKSENLTGNDEYYSEKYGKQPATMTVKFLLFPQILHLHLCRFKYDPIAQKMVKINSQFKFPMVFDVAPFLAEKNEHKGSTLYDLFGVIVHSGTPNHGHYYACLRVLPNSLDSEWFKFNDTSVTAFSMTQESLEDFYGGLNDYHTNEKNYSAYMLIYARHDCVGELYRSITDDEIPSHILRDVIEKEYSNNSKIDDQRNDIDDHPLVPETIFTLATNEDLRRAAALFQFYPTTSIINETKDDHNSTQDSIYSDNDKIEISIGVNDSLIKLYRATCFATNSNEENIRIWSCDENYVPQFVIDYSPNKMVSGIPTTYLFFERIKNPQKESRMPVKKSVFVILYAFIPGRKDPLTFLSTWCVKGNYTILSFHKSICHKLQIPEDSNLNAYIVKINSHFRYSFIQVNGNEQLKDLLFKAYDSNKRNNQIVLRIIFEVPEPINVQSTQYPTSGSYHCIYRSVFYNEMPLKLLDYSKAYNTEIEIKVVRNHGKKINEFEKNSLIPKKSCLIRIPSIFKISALKRMISRCLEKKYDEMIDFMVFYIPEQTSPFLESFNNDLPISEAFKSLSLIPKIYPKVFKNGNIKEGGIQQYSKIFRYNVYISSKIFQIESKFNVFLKDSDIFSKVLKIAFDKGFLLRPSDENQQFSGIISGIYNDRIMETFQITDPISPICDRIRIDLITEKNEDLPLNEEDHRIQLIKCEDIVAGSSSVHIKVLSQPFSFKIIKDETFVCTKKRIWKYVFKDEKIRFFLIKSISNENGTPTSSRVYLKDDEILYDIIGTFDEIIYIWYPPGVYPSDSKHQFISI